MHGCGQMACEKTADNWRRNQEANKAAKKNMAVAKATHYGNVKEKLESRGSERHPSTTPTYGPVQKITVEETEAALKKMRPGKTSGPDDVAADLWKSKYWYPAEWLAKFFNQVVPKKELPKCWRQSTTIPIREKEGSPAGCSNYRPTRLLSHSKIFERIDDGRIHDIVQLSSSQCGFVAGCGTIDAKHADHFLSEKNREKQNTVHITFLDLEKAFDRVPIDVIWYALRRHLDPEELIDIMEAKMLRCTAGVMRMDRIRNGVIRQMFEDSVLKTGLIFEVIGKLSRERPKQRWSDTLHMDLKVAGVHPDLALDRERWRHNTRIADPATGQTQEKKKKKKKKKEERKRSRISDS
ncbi:unnamed protein product [Heligmosomoides polygyrus]|uniref:Reverse transcriptase domain-containing protein n=1 Tax=Heligmosomoides polygyrus TaxID=6339 RepID=A0A183FMM8_HELPZ|nr:unnamed protein product [Heligmosomoides polygyrus]